jgi:hypothetical protein
VENKEINIERFLSLYFFELERKLNSNKGLDEVKFQSEEANTDEFLKLYMKSFILQNNSITTQIKSLKININGKNDMVNVDELKSFRIEEVLIPSELTKSQKEVIAKKKTSVYTNPDLLLKITNEIDEFYESVELKSTKDNNIPGSSIQQVSPFEWVIFVKRNERDTEVSIGHYINCITEKLPFPDRSPRPQIGYKTLKEWNNKYRVNKLDYLEITINVEETESKKQILLDWQDYLASEWLEIVKQKTTKNSEKWFNNALRKYTIKLLEYTSTINDEERKKLTERLKSLVKL